MKIISHFFPDFEISECENGICTCVLQDRARWGSIKNLDLKTPSKIFTASSVWIGIRTKSR